MRAIPEEDQSCIIIEDDRIQKSICKMQEAERNKSVFDNMGFVINDREGDEDLGHWTIIGVI